MGLRCELCDDWLSLFQMSKLCDTCYKTRTIVKAYSAQSILRSLEEHFLVNNLPPLINPSDPEPEPEPELKKPDAYKNVNSTETSTPTADDQKDYDKPKTRHGNGKNQSKKSS